MALILGYNIVQLLLRAMNGEAPRKPSFGGANDVIAFTVITVHVNDGSPYDHVTEPFIAFTTCNTPILCHIYF